MASRRDSRGTCKEKVIDGSMGGMIIESKWSQLDHFDSRQIADWFSDH
jgi:hypothetical protein